MSISASKGSLVDVGFSDTNLVVAGPQVNLGEVACTLQAVHQVFDERERVPILDCDFVQGTIVDAESQSLVLLVYKKYRSTV